MAKNKKAEQLPPSDYGDFMKAKKEAEKAAKKKKK
jgi:hypothetical protein